MQNDSKNLIITLLIVLIIVVVLFMLLDCFLKGGTKKTVEKAPAKTEKAEKQIETKPTPVENKVLPAMQIYNSELADDLEKMLKNTNLSEPARLEMEKHLNKESNIAKYIQSKNYHNLDFDSEEDTVSNNEDETLTFNREDYKRFLALSNIDEDKPL